MKQDPIKIRMKFYLRGLIGKLRDSSLLSTDEGIAETRAGSLRLHVIIADDSWDASGNQRASK